MMRTLRLCSLNNFQIYHTSVLAMVIITSLYPHTLLKGGYGLTHPGVNRSDLCLSVSLSHTHTYTQEDSQS